MAKPSRPIKILLDANIFCALENPTDSTHNKVTKMLQTLDQKPHTFFTTNFVLLECYTVISQNTTHQSAVRFGNKIQSQQTIKIIPITPTLEQLTWNIFSSPSSKNLSYVDCSLLALLQQRPQLHLLSLDRHLLGVAKRLGHKTIKHSLF